MWYLVLVTPHLQKRVLMGEAVTLMITTPGEHNCEGELWQSNPAVNNLDCRLLGNVIASGNMGDELFEVVQVIH